jgi:hypothetical protein
MKNYPRINKDFLFILWEFILNLYPEFVKSHFDVFQFQSAFIIYAY